jgi:hypothetical protein
MSLLPRATLRSDSEQYRHITKSVTKCTITRSIITKRFFASKQRATECTITS